MSDNKGPKLKGKPSPSLKRMRQMNDEELAEHIRVLEDQMAAHERRIGHMRTALDRGQVEKNQQQRLRRVEDELDRLNALVSEARRMTGRRER